MPHPETPGERIRGTLDAAKRPMSLPEIVQVSGLEELAVLDALLGLLRRGQVDADTSGGKVRFVSNGA